MTINDPNYRYATHTWETDGVRTDYDISFDGGYIKQEYVVAYSVAVDPGTGVVSDRQTHTLTFVSEVGDTATVRISPAVPAGRRVVIYRSTEKGAPLVLFTADSVLTKANLDLVNRQATNNVAEIMDLINQVDTRGSSYAQQIVDQYALSQLVYAQILELLAQQGITTVEPKYWQFTGDGVLNTFPIEDADITNPVFYDVVVDGAVIEPYDGFTVNIGMDTSASSITLTNTPANLAEGWVVLRGYARALNSDYLQTIINSPEFLSLLEQIITNTLYESTTVLRLGPLASLIPLYSIAGTTATADKTYESALLRCTNAAATTITIRTNTGAANDWTNNANGAPYFSMKQVSTGQVSVVADVGGTLKVPTGFLAKTRALNSVITATADALGSNEWTLSGDLAPDPAYIAGAPIAPCAWSSIGSSSSVGGSNRPIYSNGGMTVLDTVTSSHGHVKATKPCLTGKRYFEVTINALGANNNPCIGVVQLNATSAQVGDGAAPSGSRNSSWGLQATAGNKYAAGISTAYGSALAATDVVMVAVDRGTNSIWWGKNGTWFNSGNPATGTNAAFTNLADWLYPAVSLSDGAKVTANFSGPFQYLPTGFSAWETGGDPS